MVLDQGGIRRAMSLTSFLQMRILGSSNRIGMKLLVLSILFSPVLLAQSQPKNNQLEVETVVRTFFKGLNQKDTALIRSTLHPSCRLETTLEFGSVKQVPISSFFDMLTAHPGLTINEKIFNLQVNVDGPLAMVWMDYEFFLEGKRSHCGVNLFTLTRNPEGWTVYNVIDSRRGNCP